MIDRQHSIAVVRVQTPDRERNNESNDAENAFHSRDLGGPKGRLY